MNYQKIYDSLIERAKNRIIDPNGIYERHHIIPRCMGGTDDSENITSLTPEEHYIAHQLLVKIYPDNYALAKAACMMIPNRKSNKLYGWLRRRFSIAMSVSQRGERNSQYGTFWITNGVTEKKARDVIPEGWEAGRLSSYLIRIEKEKKRAEREKQKEKKRKEKVQELRRLYEIYKESGFKGVKATGYNYTQVNLVSTFARYLPEFVPQNGKPRA